MISKTMQTILHALSYGNIEVEASRRLADIKRLDAMRIFVKKLDTKVYNGTYEVPVRLYFPSEEAMSGEPVEGEKYPVLLFFHGGGWVTESVENYDRVCSRMAQSTGHIVMSVEYRLAPEYRFPVPLEDCYAAAKALIRDIWSFPLIRTGSRSLATVPGVIWQRRYVSKHGIPESLYRRSRY